MTRTRVMAYGVLGLPLAFAALPIYVHLPRFYAERTEMGLGLLGLILLGARLLDAVIDPWLGWLADRLPRRQMLALALLPFGLGFCALFNPPAGFAMLWLLGALAMTYLGFSAATVAYQAWGASVGGTSAIRTRLTAAREGFGLLGVVLAAALPGLLSDDLSAGTQQLTWVLPPVLLLAAGISLVGVGPGPLIAVSHAPLGLSLKAAWGDVTLRRLLWVFVANGVAAALPATLFLFFVADVLGDAAASGPLLALYFVSGAASMPVWVKLARWIGRVRAWGLAMLLAIVSFAASGVLGHGDVVGFACICFASGLALGADLIFPSALAADLGERQGQSGAVFGIWNFAAKLNLALAAGLSLPLLGWLGYQPGETGGLPALSFAYALLPLGFKAIALALLWRWRHSLEIQS